MKTIVRLATLALVVSLTGMCTAAWGAESVINLISQGEITTAHVHTGKAALEAATRKNDALAAQGKQIAAAQQQLQADIAALTAKEGSIKQETAAFKSSCENTKTRLTPDQYKACKVQHNQLKSDITQVNSQPPILKKRQADFIARANKFNKEVVAAPGQVQAADATYRNALASQEQWLDRARNLVATPAFQAYAKKANCPDVMQPPKTIAGVMRMSNGILACLKKVAGIN